MIAIVDYGLGNIKAFANVYKRLNIEYCLASNPEDFENASKIILPGVGAFDFAMSLLNDSGLRETLENKVMVDKIPVLGICVGMQMLAKSSEEGSLGGLGWIDGIVKKFSFPNSLSHQFPLPHMGWNSIQVTCDDKLLVGLDKNPRYYFLHSYFFDVTDSSYSIATSNYGNKFSCIVKRDHIYGIQCHPEKSHHNGVQLLKNFAEL